MLAFKSRILPAFLFIFAALAFVSEAEAAIQVCPLFQDNAVLQRDHPIIVFGTGDDGDQARVVFAGQTATAEVVNGRWRAILHAMPAGGPYVLKVDAKSGEGSITAQNVMVGEVWLCSGQSNMAFPLSRSSGGEDEASSANDPGLRLFKVESDPSAYPQTSFSKPAAWRQVKPGSAGGFSAVAYYFGKELREDLHVPVGLIDAAWGGTCAESWTDAAAQRLNPATSEQLGVLLARHQKDAASYPQRLDEFAKTEAKYESGAANAYVSGVKPPARPRRPVDPQKDPNAPGYLYDSYIAPVAGYQIAGVVWYQGESNIGRGGEYGDILAVLIDNWRSAWQEGFLPFFVVQLPKYAANPALGWVEVREGQRQAALTKADVGLAVVYDAGEANNLHPANKRIVADRLCLLAKKMVYNEPVECDGPVFVRALQTGDGKMKIVFAHADGLAAGDGSASVKGFALAGSDGVFHDADASIDGDSVIAQSPDVSTPLWVRYNWVDVPRQTLINSAKLPASPFRTDRAPLAPESGANK